MKYTPYQPPKYADGNELKSHQEMRSFYDMSGSTNIYKYIMTEGKRSGKRTFIEYLQKNTGVFNQHGIIPKEQVMEMMERANKNKGNIWHGFISLNKHDSEKIDTPEKCIDLVKKTFPMFFKEAHLGEKNIDLMCALHLDKPEHLHIHFVFWEKEAKYVGASGEKQFRAKGRISEQAIDNMFVRLGMFVGEDKGTLPKARDNALQRLREMTAVKIAMTSRTEIKEEILSLAKDLPTTGRLSYGSKDMEPFRERVDKIVNMILDYDEKARKSNHKFYLELDKKKEVIANICGKPLAFSEGNKPEDIPVYHHKIDENNIKIVETIEEDYKRRQGNLVINLAKFIKPEYYERNKKVRYRTNDNKLKRKLSISKRKISQRFSYFINSIGRDHQLLERDFSRRLQEIEEEMKAEKKRQEQEAAKNNKGVSNK